MKEPCIIFDCDGVLVDSETLANRALLELVKPLGISMPIEEAVRRFKGRKMTVCIDEMEAMAGRPFPDDFVPRFRARMAEAFKAELEPINGIAEALEKIGNPKCVASSGPLEKIELSLATTGLRSHFSGRIFSAYVVRSWKPDPGLFLHAAKAMGFDPRDCVVVEDSEPGVEAGVAAGMKVLGYAENGNGQELAERGAYLFDDMALLPELVSRTS